MNKELIEELKTQDFNVVAVSKTRTKEEIDEVAKMGLTTFGENRVQEFIDKYDPKYTWHIIGHLQTNKVKYIVGKVDVIESLDSLKLAEEIEKQANKHGIIQKVLVELNIPWWRSHPIHENRATESICTEPCNPLLRATKSTKRATSA